MTSTKAILYLLICFTVIYIVFIYYSEENISEREFKSMLARGDSNLIISQNYMRHHQHATDWEYDQALRLAVLQDNKYLDEVINYYSDGTLRLDMSTANIIIQQLPSDLVGINYAAGRIFSTNEFNHFDPIKATKHLEYAALREDKNAAETLSQLYTQAECYIEAITWAKVANSRNASSECTQLPVDVNLLTEEQWDAVLFNEQALKNARKNNKIAKLKTSAHCSLLKK